MPVIVISILFAALVCSPYIVGVMQAASGITFTGAVHYSLDYYYYLSYMAQGKLRWLTSIDINTQESMKPVFYHWLYVLSGRVFAILGISNILGYQLLVLGLTILLLFLSYRLICAIIPSHSGRTIAYILFLVSNAWPYVSHAQNGWFLGYYQSWYNYGEPFIRFSSIPHHLLAQSVLIITLLVLTRLPHMVHTRYVCIWVLLLVSGFLLASTQTPLVAIILLTYGIFWVKDSIVSGIPKLFLSAAVSSPIFPALMCILAGAGPYILYLRMLSAYPPISLVIRWEASANVSSMLLRFFWINGPVMLLGIIGLPIFLTVKSRTRSVIAVCTLLSWGIFLSQIPQYISVLNVRFLSVIPTLTMASSAAVLIETISNRVSQRIRVALRIGMVLLIFGLTLPATIQLSITRATFDPANRILFLPNTVIDIYTHAEILIRPEETCFVIWPYNVSFSGLTGRRSFIVSGYSTINYQSKEQQQNAFFSDQTPLDQKIRILKSNNISCVVTYSFTSHLPTNVLTPVYRNSYIIIYRVIK
jgi:hypothetical protein